MKSFKYIATMLMMLTLFSSCDDSSTNPDTSPPSIEKPNSQKLVVGSSADLTFSITTDEGFKSASVNAQKGKASVSSKPNSGVSNGDVVVNYTANSTGAGSVDLTINDQAGQSSNATAVVENKNEVKEITVTDNITSDKTWEDGKTYILGGRIAVEAGATLTIEGGAVVKGEAGAGSNASTLLVAQDATLNANGSASAPIIFTSVADEITPEMIDNGNFGSPNLKPNNKGLWGGVIVLGNAPISVSSGTEAQIEGIPSSDTNGQYGGNDAGDSSGSLSYITIRHGGTNIGQGNEINGLSLGGVGTSTTLENIEVVANQDDGLEFFGGTAEVKNVLVWNNGDDAIDTDQAWAGELDNVVIVSPGESGFELDGPEGSYTSSGHTIKNGTVYMKGNGSEELIDVDDKTDVNISNILFYGLPVNSDGTAGVVVSSDYPDFADNTNGYAFSSLEAVIPSGLSLSDYFTDGSDSQATAVSDMSSATVGADASVFDFTWASTSGALSDIGL